MRLLRLNLFKSLFLCTVIGVGLVSCKSRPSSQSSSLRFIAEEGKSSSLKQPLYTPENNIASDSQGVFRLLSGQRQNPLVGERQWSFDLNPCTRRSECRLNDSQTQTTLFTPPLQGVEKDYGYRWLLKPVGQKIDQEAQNQPITYSFSVWIPDSVGMNVNDPSVVTMGVWVDEKGSPILSQKASQEKMWVEFDPSPNQFNQIISKPYDNGYLVRGEWNTITVQVVWSHNPQKGMLQWVYNGTPLLNYRGVTLSENAVQPPQFLAGVIVQVAPLRLEKTSVQGVRFDAVSVQSPFSKKTFDETEQL
jgi:hypothetical protein